MLPCFRNNMKKQVSLREEAGEEKQGKFTKLNYLVKSYGRKKTVVVLYAQTVTAKIMLIKKKKRALFIFFKIMHLKRDLYYFSNIRKTQKPELVKRLRPFLGLPKTLLILQAPQSWGAPSPEQGSPQRHRTAPTALQPQRGQRCPAAPALPSPHSAREQPGPFSPPGIPRVGGGSSRAAPLRQAGGRPLPAPSLTLKGLLRSGSAKGLLSKSDMAGAGGRCDHRVTALPLRRPRHWPAVPRRCHQPLRPGPSPPPPPPTSRAAPATQNGRPGSEVTGRNGPRKEGRAPRRRGRERGVGEPIPGAGREESRESAFRDGRGGEATCGERWWEPVVLAAPPGLVGGFCPLPSSVSTSREVWGSPPVAGAVPQLGRACGRCQRPWRERVCPPWGAGSTGVAPTWWPCLGATRYRPKGRTCVASPFRPPSGWVRTPHLVWKVKWYIWK